MSIIRWVMLGGMMGWLASIVMKTDAKQGVVLNVLIGIAGALLAAVFLAPLFAAGTVNHGDFSLPSLLVSLLGAVVLLGVVHFVRRGGLR